MNLYTERLQKLQREFKAIKIRQANKWQFQSHEQAMYDFVMQTQKSTTFSINDYTATMKVGNKDFGFMHILLRHYCNGEITANDILKIGNVIKNDISIPTDKNNRIKFIQNKGNDKYTVILIEKKPNDLIFTFFSSK